MSPLRRPHYGDGGVQDAMPPFCGAGPALAKHRVDRGSSRTLDDLNAVPGPEPETLEKCKGRVVFKARQLVSHRATWHVALSESRRGGCGCLNASDRLQPDRSWCQLSGTAHLS